MEAGLSLRGARHIGQVVLVVLVVLSLSLSWSLSAFASFLLQPLCSCFPQHGNRLEVQWSLIEKELRQRQQMSSSVSSEAVSLTFRLIWFVGERGGNNCFNYSNFNYFLV